MNVMISNLSAGVRCNIGKAYFASWLVFSIVAIAFFFFKMFYWPASFVGRTLASTCREIRLTLTALSFGRRPKPYMRRISNVFDSKFLKSVFRKVKKEKKTSNEVN
jgi:hypothetical protein